MRTAIFSVLILLTACSTQRSRQELASTGPRAQEIRRAMDDAVIREIDLENVTTAEALKKWSEASQAAHPHHYQLRYALQFPMTYTRGPATPATAATPAKVSVRRRDITSRRLLDEICRQSNMMWQVMGRVVVVRPAAAMANGRS